MNQLTNAQTTELLRLFAEIMRELKSRGVIRTSNNPVADIGEWVVAQAFDLTLAPNSVKGYDALDIQGLRSLLSG